MIGAGADVNFWKDDEDYDVLGQAVVCGCEEIVRDLLAAGANSNRGDRPYVETGRCTLHVAADWGFEGIVSALLDSGADKDALDCEGSTALMIAADANKLAVVKVLLAAGADVGCHDEDPGFHTLFRVAKHGYKEILHAILGHGVDVNAAGNAHGSTALHIAAAHGHAHFVDALMEAGATTELKDLDGVTPLCLYHYEPSHHDAMRALVQGGASIDT